MNRIILDVASCPIDGAERWLETPKPNGNLRDPEKIVANIAEKAAKQRDEMALDLDLCRISAIGYHDLEGGYSNVMLAKTEGDERSMLVAFSDMLRHADTITFNGLAFDLPLLERRMLYQGLPPLVWNLDRYRSPHLDLCARLSDNGKRPYRSLGFYAKRLGWTDLSKPLTGAEEALAPSRGQWKELEQSVRHDVIATKRLAEWMRVIQPVEEAVL